MRADWMGDVLRDAGLIVEEVAGWQASGHGDLADDGIVVVNHHTAGGPNGRAPSLSTVIYGVPGVSGPLCNVLQTREESGPDHFIVVAAGVSWNAGDGGWNGSTGNWKTIGLEVEHTGVEHYPESRAEYTRRFNAAVLKHQGYQDAAMLCQHFEWSTAGKIDIAQDVDPELWRSKTTMIMQGGPIGPPPEPYKEFEMRSSAQCTMPSGRRLWVVAGTQDQMYWKLLDANGNSMFEWNLATQQRMVGVPDLQVTPDATGAVVTYVAVGQDGSWKPISRKYVDAGGPYGVGEWQPEIIHEGAIRKA